MRISYWSSDVCSSDRPRQLERLRIELAGRRQMRPAAHVEPVGAGPVDGQFLALGQFGRPFGLERLAAVLPARDQVLTLPDFPTERFVGGDDLSHLRLDGGQVLVRERSEEHTSELQSLMRISYAVF